MLRPTELAGWQRKTEAQEELAYYFAQYFSAPAAPSAKNVFRVTEVNAAEFQINIISSLFLLHHL